MSLSSRGFLSKHSTKLPKASVNSRSERHVTIDQTITRFSFQTDKQPSKAEVIKLVNRGTSKLWSQVGSTLEHIVLWWSDAPLACRPVACARHLRDWLLIIQPEGLDQRQIFVPFRCLSVYHFSNRCTRTDFVNITRIGGNLDGVCNYNHMG